MDSNIPNRTRKSIDADGISMNQVIQHLNIYLQPESNNKIKLAN